MKKALFLLFIFSSFAVFGQTLTISSTGETGTSGTNWSTTGTNPVIISATGNADINTSVIIGYLNTGASVMLQSSQDLVLSNSIVVGVLPNDATLTLKANKNLFINSNVSIDATQNSNTYKLNIILHSDSDGSYITNGNSNAAGAIQLNDGGSLKSNGGNIILGGGLDITTGSALATGVATDNTGINLINTTINSAGGTITMRGMGTHATGKSLGIMLNAGTNINSGSGKINIFGRSESFIGDNSGQFKNGIRFNGTSVNPITIMSSNTSSDAITLSGQEGYWTGNINTSGGSGNYREGLSFVYTNITTSGGITFAADKQVYNNTTVTTSGTNNALNITSFESNSFWDSFEWNGTLSGNNFVGSASVLGLTINNLVNLGGLTLGKPTNTSDITVISDISISGPISVYGGDIAVNANLTSTSVGAAALLKGSGSIEVQDNMSIQTNGGDLILWSNSDNLNDGHILTGQNVTLDSRQGIASTGGGHIHIGGGTDTNNDGFPDDATAANANSSGGSAYGILFGNAAGSGVQLLSGGGNITLIGGVDGNFNAAANSHGIGFYPGYTINSGPGNITFNGYANSGGATTIGIDLMTFGATNASSITTTGDLTLNGVTTVTTNNNLGIVLNNGLTIDAGTVNITGNSEETGLILNGSITSDGSMTLRANSYSFNSANVLGQGTLTIEPLTDSNSFSETFNTTNLTLGSGLTGLTIGKPTNTSNITFGSNTTIAGPITAYGALIDVNANLSSNATTGTGISLNGQRIIQDNGIDVTTAGANISYTANEYVTTGNGENTLF